MTETNFDVSAAITLYLKHYPAKNDAEFEVAYQGDSALFARGEVRTILDEAMRIEPDWSRMSLNEAGDYVEDEMHARHPELSAKALESIGNYYTYLMR